MKLKLPSTIFTSLFLLLVSISAPAQQEPPPPPPPAGFFTLIKTPLAIEGMTGDGLNLYIPGRNPGAGNPCPVWRVNIHKPSLVVVGFIPPPSSNTQCAPLGLTFNFAGELFVADGDRIYTFTPNESEPPTATLFASGVPGANGVAFDGFGRLWTGDGTTNQGRVWRIDPTGGVCEPDFIGCAEVFRIQPMRNGTALGGNITVPGSAEPAQGVGRQARTFPHTAAGGNPQDLVANGLVFNENSSHLFISDTARGAIWAVTFDAYGEVISPTGCDETFTPNTLCLENVFVAHPFLEGADGILLDGEGNIWADANERNAVVLVTPARKVAELFRNKPDPTTGLRNTFPFEFPTSPVLIANFFCTANSDGNRRDNFPNTAGEIRPAGPDVGKISCIRFH